MTTNTFDPTGLSIFLLSIASLSFITNFNIKKKESKEIEVSELWIYPIKSCKGIKISKSKITKTGFLYDRIFMLIDENNNFFSQRTNSKMALIITNILSDQLIMEVKAPGMETTLKIPLDTTSDGKPLIEVTIWDDKCMAYELSGYANSWFSEYLNNPNIRFVKMDEKTIRKTDPNYAPKGKTSFSDGYPFLIASVNSLNALNEKLDNKITMERFRPNIIVENCDSFAEDGWENIQFESQNNIIKMSIVKPCSRCKIPTINPSTGEVDNIQLSKVMKSFRSGKVLGYKKPSWGSENLDHEGQDKGEIKIGDIVKVLSSR